MMDKGYLPIFFFSGTGNTWWVGSELANALSEQGFHAEALSIEQVSRPQISAAISQAAIVGLGYPIYGSDAPLVVQDFIAALPVTEERKPMLVFATQAVWSGDGAYFMRSEIEAKGYQIRWAVHFNMPMNVCLDCGFVFNFLFRSANAKPAGALKRIHKLAGRVAVGKTWIMGRSPLFSFGWMQRLPFRKTMRFWQTSVLCVDPERCTACGRCEQLCPVGNIQLEDGLPQFGDQCNLCLRCFNYCPELAVLAFNKPFSEKWYGEAPYQGPVPEFTPEQLIEG
jgi:NAD-dependent dihydropyrimidine dehydrogenase PreA subunit/flavodoxin